MTAARARHLRLLLVAATWSLPAACPLRASEPGGEAGAPPGLLTAPSAGDLVVDVGTRTSAATLGYGWSRSERKGAQRFRWVKALEADVWFEWPGAGAADAWLRAAPFYLHYRRQNIGLYVNNRFVVEWVCPDSPDFADFHAVVPAGMLREGRNRLTLRMGYKARPPGDGRELALAVDKVVLRPR